MQLLSHSIHFPLVVHDNKIKNVSCYLLYGAKQGYELCTARTSYVLF